MKQVKINKKIVSTQLDLEELSNWIGKEVEIIIKEKEKETGKTPQQKTAAGILQGYKNENLFDEEKKAWNKVVREKYANS